MAEHLARLIEVSVTLNSTLNQDELLQFIIRTATEILDCESVSILLYDEKRDRLFFAAATGSDPKKLAETPVPLEKSLAGTIFRENKVVCLSDVQRDARHFLAVSKLVNIEVKNLLGVPMRIHDKPTGVLEALNKRDGDFDESDADILAVIASQAAVAIHNARMVEALQDANNDLRDADQLKTNFRHWLPTNCVRRWGSSSGMPLFSSRKARASFQSMPNRCSTLPCRCVVWWMP